MRDSHPSIQFKNRPQIDIGFSCPCLHLDGKVTALELGDFLNPVRLLYVAHIFQKIITGNMKPVRKPKFGLEQTANLE